MPPVDQAGHVEPTLACVTVSYYSGEAIRDLLRSLASSDVRPCTTVVANNASDDADRLAAFDLEAQIVDSGANIGYGSAVNRAIATLPRSIEWVLISNPDVIVQPSALGTMLDAARADSTAGAIGPKIVGDDGEVYPSARELPALRTGVGHAVLANAWPGNPWSRRYRAEAALAGSRRRSTGWLSGSFLLVRRAAFEEIGGFDEDYFMYFEDVDLGRRLSRAGWTNVYEPGAVVTHSGAHSTRHSAGRMRAEHHRSAYRYLSHRYAAWYLLPLRLVLRAGLAIRARVSTRG